MISQQVLHSSVHYDIGTILYTHSYTGPTFQTRDVYFVTTDQISAKLMPSPCQVCTNLAGPRDRLILSGLKAAAEPSGLARWHGVVLRCAASDSARWRLVLDGGEDSVPWFRSLGGDKVPWVSCHEASSCPLHPNLKFPSSLFQLLQGPIDSCQPPELAGFSDATV